MGAARSWPTCRARSGAATLRLERVDDQHFTLDPWPFASQPVEVGCEGRLLEGWFSSDAELHAALAAAPWLPLRWELSPG